MNVFMQMHKNYVRHSTAHPKRLGTSWTSNNRRLAGERVYVMPTSVLLKRRHYYP